MKPILSLFITLSLLLLGGSCDSAVRNNVLVSFRLAPGATPDESWQVAESIKVKHSEISDNSMTVRSLWDSDSLYIRFDVTDSDLRAFQTEKDHSQLFLDDMVEVLFDTEMDRSLDWQPDDIVYHINILGQKKDDKGMKNGVSNFEWDGTASYRIFLDGSVNDGSEDAGYTVVVAFSWTELGRTPYSGLKMGINFANGDNDGKGRQLYNWCDADPMRTPSVFGTLELE